MHFQVQHMNPINDSGVAPWQNLWKSDILWVLLIVRILIDHGSFWENEGCTAVRFQIPILSWNLTCIKMMPKGISFSRVLFSGEPCSILGVYPPVSPTFSFRKFYLTGPCPGGQRNWGNSYPSSKWWNQCKDCLHPFAKGKKVWNHLSKTNHLKVIA